MAGFAVDVLNEAALRENVTLAWLATNSSKEAENDLASGRIDFMPAGMITAERRRIFYVSEPWWSTELTLLTRANDLKVNSLGITPIYADLAAPAFPSARLVPFFWSEMTIKAVCSGRVDAALVTHGEMHDIFLNRPEECNGVRLASGDTSVDIQLAIISRKANRDITDRLRTRIDEMALDGTLLRLAAKNPPIPTAGAVQLEKGLRERFRRRVWTVGAGLVVPFILWFAYDKRRDFAERRRGETALRDSEHRYRALFECMQEGFYIGEIICDDAGKPVDFRILDVNPACESSFGRTREQLVGRTHRELFPNSESDHWPAAFGDVALTRQPVHLEHYAPDTGRHYDVRSYSPQAGQFAVVFSDVSDRKRAQDQLRDSEERFRTLADNIAQLAWMADGEGRVFWYNKRWYEFTGMSAGSIAAWDSEDIIHPEDSDHVRTRLRGSFDSGELWEDTFRLRGQDGQYRWFLSRAVPIRDDDSRVVRWLGTSTDITDQKRTETALRRSNDDLQQFAYIASHDLREPLRNLSTHSEFLARIYKNGQLAIYGDACLHVITTAAKRMEALITGLLAYARATTDCAVVREAVDMNTVLDETLKNLQTAIEETGASVTSDPLPVIRADYIQMVQVFQNLIGNSLKYRRNGVPPSVDVGIQERHDTWLFSVRDNGEGFKPEYSEKIFGIFKRLHGDELPGTGIGLSICKAIIDRHGGEMCAEGRPGEGAAIYFTLPRVAYE